MKWERSFSGIDREEWRDIHCYSSLAWKTSEWIQNKIRWIKKSESNNCCQIRKRICEYKCTWVDPTLGIHFRRKYHSWKIFRLNRPEKSKSCERCEEFEKIIENERKSNSQLKRLIEQNEKQKSTTSSNSNAQCSKCSNLNELLKIEKDHVQQLNQQILGEKKLTEQERNSKEVSLFSMIFKWWNSFSSFQW